MILLLAAGGALLTAQTRDILIGLALAPVALAIVGYRLHVLVH